MKVADREHNQPPGVILHGQRSCAKRINSWSAHFGNVCIGRDYHIKRCARDAAWKWWDRTTLQQRDAIMAKTKADEGMTAEEWRDVVRVILMGRSRNAKHLCDRLSAMPDDEMSEVLTMLVERGQTDLGIIKGDTKISFFATNVVRT